MSIIIDMPKHTPLYKQHLALKAHLVDFVGWTLPLHYGSQIREHHVVRQQAGIFDVSHMGIIDISGDDSRYFLRHLLANDIAKLKTPGLALYTCMLNEKAGIIDDLIIYYLKDRTFRLVVNAATWNNDLNWMQQNIHLYEISITKPTGLAMIALQGPDTFNKIATIINTQTADQLNALKPFQFIEIDDIYFARTGYTGELGLELMGPSNKLIEVWEKSILAGIAPCGLGARDTLRLEAGFNLYGVDMDTSTTPLTSNLGWTVSWNDPDRDFIGKQALKYQLSTGITEELVGVLLEEHGVLRHNETIYFDDAQQGCITSGGFSPTLNKGIALARLPIHRNGLPYIERRGKRMRLTITKHPFFKR